MAGGVDRIRMPQGCMVLGFIGLVVLFLLDPLRVALAIGLLFDDPDNAPPATGLNGQVVKPLPAFTKWREQEEAEEVPPREDPAAGRRERTEDDAIAVFGAYDGRSMVPEEESGLLDTVPAAAWAGLAGVGVLGACGAVGWLLLGGREPDPVPLAGPGPVSPTEGDPDGQA